MEDNHGDGAAMWSLSYFLITVMLLPTKMRRRTSWSW